MANSKRLMSLVFVSLLGSSALFPQTEMGVDSVYERTIDKAWKIIAENRSKKLDSATVDPQQSFAKEFLKYYIKNPETKTGQKALRSAFSMWANLHDTTAIHEATPYVSTDSDIWALVLNSIAIAYGPRNWNNYLQFINSLSTRLTHPKSLAEILLTIGTYRLSILDNAGARSYFAKVLSLKAYPDQLEKASRGLYEIDTLAIGQPAPDFVGVSVDGEAIQLSRLKGKNVLLEFTGTWCGPCWAELPYLKSAYSKYSQQGLVFVAVSQDDSASTVRRYAKEKGISWPQILAPEYASNPIVRSYNATAIPRIFLIDSQGKIAASYIRGEKIEKAIERLLADHK